MNLKRTTLKEETRIGGRGLHSGQDVEVRIRPGDQGIRFCAGESIWPATPSSVTETKRCTRLGEISTVEHLMSALCGLEITDADIDVRGGELPGLDGSAAPFVAALRKVGIAPIGERDQPAPFARVFVKDSALEVAVSRGTGHWRYLYDVEPRWPGQQAYEVDDVAAAYEQEIAPARTFAMDEEVPALLAAGLGLGLDESSVVVLGPKGYANEPRFSDEPAQHKLLDLMGDLYLSGVPARCLNVVAERSGHTSNVKAAALLWQYANPPA